MVSRLVLLALLGACVCLADRAQLTVNWAQVPATSTRQILDGTIGKCICDDHADGCDANCCCDADCFNETARIAFTSCRRETAATRRWTMCYERDAATDIVRQNSETLDQVVVADKAVCTVRDNFPQDLSLTFFVPAAALGAAEIPAPVREEWFKPPAHINFMAGDRIPILAARQFASGWRVVAPQGGYLSPLSANEHGVCSADKVARFLHPLTSSTCSLVGSLPEICAVGGINSFLYLAIAPASYSILDATTIVPVVAHVLNDVTGALIATVDPSPAFTAILNGPLSSVTVPIATEFDYVTGICSRLLRRVIFTITYDYSGGVGVVSAAKVQLYVTDVPATSTRMVADVASVLYFQDKAAAAPPAIRKGTPGYFTGESIPAGVSAKNDTKSAVLQQLPGLSVPSGKWCSSGRFRPVSFLHDVLHSGCSMLLTESELRAVCVASGGSLSLLTKVFQATTAEPSVFGATVPATMVDLLAQTANARPENIDDWIPIRGVPLTLPQATPYNLMQQRCDNLIVGLRYTIVVGRAGVEYNPQDIIVGARVEPIVGSWTFRNASYTPDATTIVSFKFAVNFERYDLSSRATQTRRVMPPPILPPIDEDVFYPFSYPSAASQVPEAENP